MKKSKILIILGIPIILLIISIIMFIIINFQIIKNIEQQPIIDNKISIKAKEIHDYMRENNYGYCTYDHRCNHAGGCGLNITFETSKENFHNTCCATYVSWVLQETGYITKQEHIDKNLNGANNLIKYLDKKGWKPIDKKDIMPGDILCYNSHIAIYGGRGMQYDAGNKKLLEQEAPCKVSGGMNPMKVLRAPEIVNLVQ